MNPSTYKYIAIDVSKSTLQIQSESRAWKIKYSEPELARFVREIRTLRNPLVAFEATGGQERRLRDVLAEAQIPFHMINTRRIRGFAASEGIRAKTDPIDAKLIFTFAVQKRLEPMQPPSEAQVLMADLMDRRSHLSEQLTREKNRLQKSTPSIHSYIEEMIDFVEKQIAQIDRAIEELIAKSERLSKLSTAMQAISGVGKVTAWTVLAYLPEIGQVKRGELAALVGVAPFNRDSGSKTGKRYIQAGRAKVRRCLFLAARTAAIHNPVIKAYVARLIKDKGKHYKQAIVAAMRKLIIHINTIVKNLNYELV
jgi:transposase